MSGLQTIIDNAISINIDRRKTSGFTISRSGIVKTAQHASNVPWTFTVTMHPGLKYSTNRALTEEIDRLDRTEESNINIGSTNSGLAYITEYQGTLTVNERAAANIVAASNSNITLNATALRTAGATASDYLVRAGDYIQPGGGYRYPYTATADVLVGSGANVTIPVHRPVIQANAYTFVGQTLSFGSNVTWRVKMVTKPSYSVVPHDRLEFSDSFQLVEIILDT
jgi:hypothetical protein